MKRIVSLMVVCGFTCCALHCQAQGKEEMETYNLGADVPEANKKIFVERAEKGKILFRLHCAGCHGIFTNGKDSVPNFTNQQIDNYHARALIMFKNHSSVRNLSSDQLDYVLTFLRLRKVEKPK